MRHEFSDYKFITFYCCVLQRLPKSDDGVYSRAACIIFLFICSRSKSKIDFLGHRVKMKTNMEMERAEGTGFCVSTCEFDYLTASLSSLLGSLCRQMKRNTTQSASNGGPWTLIIDQTVTSQAENTESVTQFSSSDIQN